MKSDCVLILVIEFLQTKRELFQFQLRNTSNTKISTVVIYCRAIFSDSQVLNGIISAHPLLLVGQYAPAMPHQM